MRGGEAGFGMPSDTPHFGAKRKKTMSANETTEKFIAPPKPAKPMNEPLDQRPGIQRLQWANGKVVNLKLVKTPDKMSCNRRSIVVEGRDKTGKNKIERIQFRKLKRLKPMVTDA